MIPVELCIVILDRMARWLGDPWRVDIVRRAFVDVAILGVVGGCLGCWVVLYGLSYGAESLSHAMFPGLVAAALLGASLVIGGMVGVLVAAVVIAAFGRIPGIERDTSVAVVISALFGVGVLLALSPASPPGIQSLLFGDILGLSRGDLASTTAVGVLILAALWLLHPQLLLVGFDRGHARSFGGHPALADVGLLVLLSLAVAVAAQGVGTLLAPAVLVGPSATARLFARRMGPMMALASSLAIVAGVTGLYFSFYAGTAAGASIAGAIVVSYVGAAILAPRVGRRVPSATAPGASRLPSAV